MTKYKTPHLAKPNPLKTGRHALLKPNINQEKCNECMVCVAFCPQACIKKSRGKIIIDKDLCDGCLICLRECPKSAIEESKA